MLLLWDKEKTSQKEKEEIIFLKRKNEQSILVLDGNSWINFNFACNLADY